MPAIALAFFTSLFAADEAPHADLPPVPLVNAALKSEMRARLDLSGPWRFAQDPDDVGVKEGWYASGGPFERTVVIPGAWQAQGVGEPDGLLKTQYIGTGWYRKTVTFPEAVKNGKLWLRVGAAHPSCEVWVNGQKLGAWEQPGQPAMFDATAAARPGRDNVVAIRVYEKNRGLGNWYGLNASWSGVWRKVEVIATGPVYIHNLFVEPDLENGRARCRVTLGGGPRSELTLRATVHPWRGGGEPHTAELKPEPSAGEACINVPMPDARLWSPEDPFLYVASIEVIRDGAVIDQAADRFGMRSVEARNDRIYLNGEPIYLRGAGDDGMYPNRLCPETDPDRLCETMRLTKACGFNYVYPCLVMQPEEYLDAADEVGLLVQYDAAAMLAFQRQWPPPMPEVTVAERDRLVLEQWASILAWTQNHPSIIIYSPGSEIGHEPILDAMYALAKSHDPTRLVLNWTVKPDRTDLVDVGNLADPLDPGENLHEIIATWQWPHEPATPGLIHEYCGVETLADPRLIPLYKTGMEPVNEKRVLEAAQTLGLEEELPALIENSQRLADDCRKFEFEEALKVEDPTGFNFWLIQDVPVCPQGFFDPFWQTKTSEPAALAKSNGDTVLLMHETRLETRRCFSGGEQAAFEFLLSHYGSAPVDGALLQCEVVDAEGEALLQAGRAGVSARKNGVTSLAVLPLIMPSVDAPVSATLRATLTAGERQWTNDWPIWLFPELQPLPLSVAWREVDAKRPLDAFASLAMETGPWEGGQPDVVVANGVDESLAGHIAGGGRALVVLRDVEGLVGTQFMPRWPHTGALNVSATIVDDHPALGAFPLEGYCGYSFYHLIGREIVTGEGYLLEYRKKRSQAIDLARFPHLESPIIRVWNMSSHAAYLAEAKCGKGVVLLTTLQFGDAVGAYPEANYLAQQLLAYLAQAEPEGRISPEALMGFAAPPGDAEHSDGAEG